MEKYRSLSWNKEMKTLREVRGQQENNHQPDKRYRQPRRTKPRSMFWTVFLSIIAAMITLSILGFGVQLAFLGAAASAIKSSFEHTRPAKTTGNQALNALPTPIRQTTKAAQDVILDMGRKNLENANKVQREANAAVKNRRRNALTDDSADMPPWEHPHKWGHISSEHGDCWYHNDTMRKVCR